MHHTRVKVEYFKNSVFSGVTLWAYTVTVFSTQLLDINVFFHFNAIFERHSPTMHYTRVKVEYFKNSIFSGVILWKVYALIYSDLFPKRERFLLENFLIFHPHDDLEAKFDFLVNYLKLYETARHL